MAPLGLAIVKAVRDFGGSFTVGAAPPRHAGRTIVVDIPSVGAGAKVVFARDTTSVAVAGHGRVTDTLARFGVTSQIPAALGAGLANGLGAVGQGHSPCSFEATFGGVTTVGFIFGFATGALPPLIASAPTGFLPVTGTVVGTAAGIPVRVGAVTGPWVVNTVAGRSLATVVG